MENMNTQETLSITNETNQDGISAKINKLGELHTLIAKLTQDLQNSESTGDVQKAATLRKIMKETQMEYDTLRDETRKLQEALDTKYSVTQNPQKGVIDFDHNGFDNFEKKGAQ